VKIPSPLQILTQELIECRLCPRLTEYRERIAVEKRRAFRDWDYWGRPVPAFGDPRARLLILGLAPAAHGANRTGRMFTGDRSGDFLFRALYETGFASQPESRSAGDGLVLRDAYITASVHCAPPDNKPAREEIANCRHYLVRELDLLRRVKVVVTLGRLAFDVYLSILKDKGVIQSRAPFHFAHNAVHHPAGAAPALISCYHPSQQNTSTGLLTLEMLIDAFAHAKSIISPEPPSK
jgi:uracil-DNA glycosylase family 4